MIGVNLLPSAVLLARRRYRRLRGWLLAVALVTAVAALPVGYDIVQATRAAALERDSGPLEARLAAVRQDLKGAAARYEHFATQIARADALRAKREWAGLLATIAVLAPDAVWLVSLETRTAPAAVPSPVLQDGRKSASPAGPPAIVLDGPTGLRLVGYSLDHERLYEFMSELKKSELFTKVDLTQAGKEPVLEGTAVRFVLDCDW